MFSLSRLSQSSKVLAFHLNFHLSNVKQKLILRKLSCRPLYTQGVTLGICQAKSSRAYPSSSTIRSKRTECTRDPHKDLVVNFRKMSNFFEASVLLLIGNKKLRCRRCKAEAFYTELAFQWTLTPSLLLFFCIRFLRWTLKDQDRNMLGQSVKISFLIPFEFFEY